MTLLLISLLPLLVLGFFSYQQSAGVIEAETQKLTNQLVRESNKVLNQHLNDIMLVSTALFTNQDLLNLLNASQGTNDYEILERKNAIGEFLGDIPSTRTDIQTVTMVDETGEVISAGLSTAALAEVDGEEILEEAWLQEVLAADGRAVWFPTSQTSLISDFQQQATYALARSLESTGGGGTFVFLFEVRESSLSELLQQMEINESGTLRVVDREGIVVSSLDEEELGATDVSRNYTFLNEEESGSLVKNDHLISYTPIGSTGWQLVVEVPMVSILEQVNHIRFFTFVLVGISAVIAFVAALFIGRQFARPIEQMREVMAVAGEGDLTAKTELRSKDEIGQLNTGYMELMGRLRQFVGRTKGAGDELNVVARGLIEQAEQNNVTYREITEATESIATGADEQAREAETSAELVGELLSKWRESHGEAETLEQVMNETQQVSEHGQTSVRELQDKNEMTEREIERLGGNLQLLEDRVEDVHKATNLIDDIMDQTKILALNAAIEAHRAGQEGRGFLVVADEVQRLSQQVLSATNTIGSSIEAIQKAMKSTWNSMKLTNEAMVLQQQTVEGTDEAFQSIRVQMDEAQTQLVSVMNTLGLVQQFEQRMSDAIQNISAVAQQSAAATEEVAALAKDQEGSSDHLVEQAHALGDIVQGLEEELSQFRVEESVATTIGAESDTEDDSQREREETADESSADEEQARTVSDDDPVS